MSNPAVLTTFGSPDPNAAPVNITQLVALLNTLVASSIQGSYVPYILGSTTPSVEDNDKAWIKTDSSGRPISINTYYNGNWRRVYNGMIGEIRMYSGDPSIDFDSSGLGNIGGNFDGWHLCNGQDGVVDLSNKFVVAADMEAVNQGYASGFQVTFDGGVNYEKTGGAPIQPLLPENIPLPARDAIVTALWSADGNAPTSGGDLWGQGAGFPKTIVPADPGLATPVPIQIVPPFIAMGFITFVGYA